MPTNYCYIHDEDEEVPENPYRVCFECGHVYITEQELLNTHREVTERFNKNDPTATPIPPATRDIGFCPLCLHDWI